MNEGLFDEARLPSRNTSLIHELETALTWLLAEDRRDEELAKHVATQFANMAQGRRFSYAYQPLIGQVLPILLKSYGEATWAVFGPRILAAKASERFLLQVILQGSATGFNKEDCALRLLPEEILLAWCRQHSSNAPHFVVRVLPPLLLIEGKLQWNPLLLRLLDEFGSDPSLCSELAGNIGTFGSVGSENSHWEKYLAPLEELRRHRRVAVRNWATKYLAGVKTHMRDVAIRDEEFSVGIY